MNGLVTTGGPARALRQTGGVIGVADENSAALFLFLEVTLQTERCVPFVQHARIH